MSVLDSANDTRALLHCGLFLRVFKNGKTILSSQYKTGSGLEGTGFIHHVAWLWVLCQLWGQEGRGQGQPASASHDPLEADLSSLPKPSDCETPPTSAGFWEPLHCWIRWFCHSDLFCVFWTIYPHFPLKPLERPESQDQVLRLDRRTIPRAGWGGTAFLLCPRILRLELWKLAVMQIWMCFWVKRLMLWMVTSHVSYLL